MTIISHSPADTEKIAEKLATLLSEPVVIALNGDLGAGKTLFVQSLAKVFGITENVTSPTFNLMNIYGSGKNTLVHFDLYRLDDEDELNEIDFFSYVDYPLSTVVVEWADKFSSALPADLLSILIERGEEEEERRIELRAEGKAQKILEAFKSTWQF